jgi:hypothetical protein
VRKREREREREREEESEQSKEPEVVVSNSCSVLNEDDKRSQEKSSDRSER